MDADIRIDHMVEENGIHRARLGTFSAPDAQLFLLDYTTALALSKRLRWTRRNAWCGRTRQTESGFKTSGQPASRRYANT
jgi:hypothetical protein